METQDKILQYSRLFYDYLVDRGYGEGAAISLNLLVNALVLTLTIIIIDQILRRVIIKAFQVFTTKTKTTFDDFLVKSNFPKYVARVIPFIIIQRAIPYVFVDFPKSEDILIKITDVYLIFLVIWILRSVVRTSKRYLKNKDSFKDKPMESYAQIVMMFFWFIGIIFIFSELTGQSIGKFLTTLGAASAILLFVFKDTILGFVASIQVSVNDMVRIGDWITQEKYGADGDVIEINLTTVKVKNFDHTITTLPTYALVSDSFRNWRGMQESGGRRIKRAIHIKASSVRFLSGEDLDQFSKIQAVKHYIAHRQKDIDKYNTEHNYDKSIAVNGRNQTNLGIFRKYCDLYLENHPATNKGLMIMTRHLAPTPQGIPIEVYLFSSDKRWENYEHIMADIFEHLIGAVSYFDLELFELPNSKDIRALTAKS
ncbi:mechanosensitive ion channel family protein [Leptobacterium sp. I13]|uniref:mechanosensitive ion channel family protein n=1 Tax=Leptobacterium meishanense TaxID=3128904 RepID=UPI0030EF8069